MDKSDTQKDAKLNGESNNTNTKANDIAAQKENVEKKGGDDINTKKESTNTQQNDKSASNREESKEEVKDLMKDGRVRLAVVGNVDSGKSTLVGVLTKGVYDNGRGSVRKSVFNFNHESEKGQTSSIGHEIMGYDANGAQQLPDRLIESRNKHWAEVTKKSTKIVVLLDLCGHRKYLKTTIFGLSGLVPDYSMVILGANIGEMPRMTQEHLGISLALKIPFFIVMTKIDMAPANVLEETLEALKTELKGPRIRRLPVVIKTDEDLITSAERLPFNKICPIFLCSNVTGEGISSLIKFIFLIQNRNDSNKMLKTPSHPVEFGIHETFLVAGVGIAISGTMFSGTIKIGSILLLGPDKSNAFRTVQVKSIHKDRTNVDQAVAGEMACLAIKPTNKKEILTRDDFRKGMVIIDPSLKCEPVWEFEADAMILHQATQTQIGYQSVVHCGVVRQTVKVVSQPKEIMKAGDRGLMRFRFLCNPEYMKAGSHILFREDETKIFGVVTRPINPKDEEKNQKTNVVGTKQPTTTSNTQNSTMQVSKPKDSSTTANTGTMKANDSTKPDPKDGTTKTLKEKNT